MNEADLFCTAVTQMIDSARLAAFASTVVSDGSTVAAPIITDARHDHVLTPRYELVPIDGGVTGRTEVGEMSMTWTAIASLLAAVTTPERARALGNAVTVGGQERPTNGASLDELCADYAHAAATAAGLLVPPTYHESDNGYSLELRSTTHRTTVSINRVELFDIRPRPQTSVIDVRAHRDSGSGELAEGFSGTVLFVPVGESNAPVPGAVGKRVGLERLDPNSDVGARWAVQVDGFDSVIVEAFPERGVRIAVYDNDPDQEYLRYETIFPVAASHGTARQRLGPFEYRPRGANADARSTRTPRPDNRAPQTLR